MESCNRNYAQSMQRNWQRQVHDGECVCVCVLQTVHRMRFVADDKLCIVTFQIVSGVLRTIGSASRRMDAKNIKIPRCAMERISIASWRIHQQAERRVTIKVSFWNVIFLAHVQCSCVLISPFACQSRTFIGSGDKAGQFRSIDEMGWPNTGGCSARHGRNSTNVICAWLRSICKSARLRQSRFMGER